MKRGRKTIYQKPEPIEVRGTCVVCGVNPQGAKRPGEFLARCSPCIRSALRQAPPHTPKRSASLRGDCIRCGENLQAIAGSGKYRAICESCRRGSGNSRERIERGSRYRLNKKKHCEECGFKAIHKCQLDVDHIDGDRTNNDPSNLRTLCANCHRLKTHLNKDHMRPAYFCESTE